MLKFYPTINYLVDDRKNLEKPRVPLSSTRFG